jgi:thiol-disulfide isomerase/thioredoxin
MSGHVTRYGRTVLVALVAVLSLAACGTSAGSASSATVTTKMYAAGKRIVAPAISEGMLGGGTFDLSAERGKVVVLNFWGSWCGPCRAEAADLESVYTATGAEFVGVNVQDQSDAASAFVAAHKITYPSVFDPAGHVMLAYRNVPPSAVPSTVVIDPTGKIAALHLGPITAAALTSLIKSAES